MGIRKIILLVILIIISFLSYAQQDYASRFFLGKSYLEKESYDLAMQILLPIANNDPENQYKEQAAYLYSVASMNDSLFFQARQMLLQITSRYSYWEGIDEARYLLSICYFHVNEPSLALNYASMIESENLILNSNNVKIYYLMKYDDLEVLRKLYDQFPNDEVLAYRFAQLLQQNAGNEEDMILLESLIDVFNFDPAGLNRSVPDQKVFKDSYNIAVYLPFKYPAVKSKIQYEKNKFAYEFYAGILQAADSLKKQGISLNIRPFDTRGDTSVLSQILNQNITREADLIIGPLYPDLSEMMLNFGLENQIIVVNPFTQNEEYIANNPYAYLFQPSFQQISRIQVQFALDSLLSDSASVNMLVMDKTATDTAMAAIVYNHLKAEGKTIDTIIVFDKTSPGQLLDLFGDSSHIVDFTNMFVTTTNREVIGRIISAVEAGNSQVKILGLSRWLEYDNIDLVQFERRHVYFPYPDYIDYNKKYYHRFRMQYDFEKMPDFYSETGFEIMMHFGLSLFKYGKYFQEGLKNENYRKGFIFSGIDYSLGNFNAMAPLMKVRDGKIAPVGYRPEVKLLNNFSRNSVFEIDSVEIIIPNPEISDTTDIRD